MNTETVADQAQPDFKFYLEAWLWCRRNNVPKEVIQRKSLWSFVVEVPEQETVSC